MSWTTVISGLAVGGTVTGVIGGIVLALRKDKGDAQTGMMSETRADWMATIDSKNADYQILRTEFREFKDQSSAQIAELKTQQSAELMSLREVMTALKTTCEERIEALTQELAHLRGGAGGLPPTA